jgi:hypothetical protein
MSETAEHSQANSAAAATVLSRFPAYEPGCVPQYSEYHAEVDFLDELESIWAAAGVHRGSGDCGWWR